ncbi:shikimate kinase [Paraclostridium sordellii]|uniref:shikimate kinase n=1 Tax=Paraclostridium sordellii TaxID=1505 RepID=UPI0005DE95C0|nr:shikimate kinase [Paeniclostridium sordellii]CEO12791.1 shikimate kinase [[Clostridium] sordellii] [Paeniclostridium sordellii]CEP87967.1 shikimate kinase [[Clostridium] sordellii] [Paeniclostridium sordellii]CEP97297.1 shikimate kinase [[Clostridium] sordellii] [Paeniclostridium sordellii]CEQ00985.1 shikimate kinase [[Clostridium] sordellii] [Paeniclostridium sordellii]
MSNIILIGFMGSGKTTIGEKLSLMKNMRFIDLDLEVEKLEKKTINDIFTEKGEQYFRNIESKLLEKYCYLDDVVISTGGGIVESKDNIEILKNKKNVIWLDGNVDTILNHLRNETHKRPKLKDEKNLEEYIKKLLDYRKDKYNKSSNIKIDINGKNIEQVISEILVYI